MRSPRWRSTSFFGLPAHPLLLHFPVVLDPLLAIVSVGLLLRPEVRRRYGLAWAAFALVCLAATVLTAAAGDAFYQDRPFVSDTLRDHKELGKTLRLVMAGFAVAIAGLVTVDWLRARGRAPTALVVAAAVAVGGLAVATTYFTIRAGHVGAKSVWKEGGEAGERTPAAPTGSGSRQPTDGDGD